MAAKAMIRNSVIDFSRTARAERLKPLIAWTPVWW